MRELAAMLKMRVSNITYYFPTKDDLVYEISLLLSAANSKVIVAGANLTLHGFMNMMDQVFHNHVRFRCLLLSFVHVMEQNKRLAASYKKNQKTRNAAIKSNIDTLNKAGFLKIRNEEEQDFIASALSLISRFWVSEATVSLRHLNTEQQIKHYLQLVARLLHPYTTTLGKKEIKEFLHALEERTSNVDDNPSFKK